MTKLLTHHKTYQKIEAFLRTPSHALLLVGPLGSGKLTMAKQLAESLLSIDTDFESYAYGRLINDAGGKSIGIEAIRSLDHLLSLKVPSKSTLNRVIIIENAHLMTLESQNALLKMLEEPPQGTVIILTAANRQALLPTVRSRVQTIDVIKPEKSVLAEYFHQAGFDDNIFRQAYGISGGLPGLMSSLLNEEDHPLSLATQKAREILGLNMYERLQKVDELAKDKPLTQNTTFILQQMARVSLKTAKGTAAQRWQKILTASYMAAEALSQNAQPKLVLTNLMLSI